MKKSSIILTGTLILALTIVGFFLFQIISLPAKISLTGNPSPMESARDIAQSFLQSETTELRGAKDGRINILLLGRAGETYSGKNLTDTIALLSIDTVHFRAGILSIPRDLYAPIPDTNLFTKINSIYQYGLREQGNSKAIEETVSFITGQPIHYTVIVDFDGFEKIIDALGGVTIQNARDIHDARYPGKNYSYETFDLSKGWHTLDGKTALKYVRERHDDPEGDFGRAKRQQEVLQAIRNKALDPMLLGNIFTIKRLLATLGESVRTDITTKEIESFLSLGKKIDSQNISASVIDAWKKESVLRVDHVDTPSGTAFVLVPRSGTWGEIRVQAKNLFDLSAKETREENIQKEHARILIASDMTGVPNARLLRNYLKDSLHLPSVETILLPKNTRADTSFISEREQLATPYALDTLLAALPLEKKDDITPALPVIKNPYDILITLGRDFNTTFLTASTENEDPRNIPDDFETPMEPAPYPGIRDR
jgi:LCP family protein required for cell wall assembly